MISVVIISYRNPTYLDLCLKSLFDNMGHKKDRSEIEVNVVLDGFEEESTHVIKKYPGIGVVAFEENQGQTMAHNTGVWLSQGEWVLIVNDDNVFCPDWNTCLDGKLGWENKVISLNQMEPRPSIFSDFIIEDCGTTPDTFDMEKFKEHTRQIRRLCCDEEYSAMTTTNSNGQTWPIFLKKKDYMRVGGIGFEYKNPSVADHDLFLKLEMSGLEFVRDNMCLMYHFAGAATQSTPERYHAHMLKEQQSHEFFKYKWGFYSTFREHNSHMPKGETIRGITF